MNAETEEPADTFRGPQELHYSVSRLQICLLPLVSSSSPHFLTQIHYLNALFVIAFGYRLNYTKEKNMTQRSTSQQWSLDIALAQGGFNALHPEAKNTMLQFGH